MIRNFGDRTTEDIYEGEPSKAALRLPRELWPRIRRKLDLLEHMSKVSELRVPPSNHLEALRGDLKGFYSIRVNDQYRIIFRDSGEGFDDVRCVDYH